MATDAKEIVFRRGALNTLTNLLQGVGWYGDTKTAYLAGDMLVNKLPAAADVPCGADDKPLQGAELKKWLNVESTLAITDAHIKTCAKCIEHFVKQNQLGVNEFTFELMDKLGMKPAD